MSIQPPRYPEDHWLRSYDSEKALDFYLEQQSKAYSRVKNDFVTELLGDLKGKRVIDYGCGAGYFCPLSNHGNTSTQRAFRVAAVKAFFPLPKTFLPANRVFAAYGFVCAPCSSGLWLR